jgi:signal transduction histidine kinase/CheY-like chemotaxis protein/HAMP domain-containing protein
MKMINMKIGTKLILGYGVILLFVVSLGVLAYYQTNIISQHASNLYNHPLKVGRAVRDINIAILDINRSIKDMVLNEKLNKDQLNKEVHNIENQLAKAYKLFDIVYDQYLGDHADIDIVYNRFKDAKFIRQEVIVLRQSGNIRGAAERYQNVYNPFIEKMIADIQEMVDFSTLKGDEFFVSMQNEKDTLNQRIIIVVFLIFIISILISYFLITGIKKPLRNLTIIADEYRQGHHEVRSNYNSFNEIGLLATTFNSMADSVQSELMVSENVSVISQQMLKENNLRPFCKIMLNAMLSKTNSHVAAIYFLNEEESHFEHYESIGLSSSNIKSFSAHLHEGEFGAVLSEKKTTYITEIPDDTVFDFPAVTGSFMPKEIISIPILNNDVVIAVVSIASLQNYSPTSIQMIKDILPTLTSRIIGVLSFQKIRDYSLILDKQNKELEDKSKELVLQSDELKEYNIELEIQKTKLDDANQLKSSFLSNMSHELRTPLNSVIALSSVLNRRLKGTIPEDEFNYLGIIERNGKNLLTLINDILDLSRIEAGKEEVYFTKFSPSDLIESLVTTIEPIAKEKNITLQNNIDSDLPMIISDIAKCNHILQNIISNAVKFTEKGSVEITTKIVNTELYISVKDTGIGISLDDLVHIFDEFRQADERSSRKFGGTGLGLAIAKKYSILLNGSLDVESVLGSGSIFTFKILIVPKEINNIEKEIGLDDFYNKNRNLLNNKTHHGKEILIVEDSEPSIIQIREMLVEVGYLVKVARNGKEALDELKVSIPDAVILDLMMPEIDGFEVLKQLRSLKETQLLPVLILSAKHVTHEELSFLKGNNIHQLIQKGDVNKKDLLGHINKMVTPSDQNAVKKKDSINDAKISGSEKNTKEAVILVVEDNPDNLETVKAILGNKFNLISSMEGIEGIQKAKTFNPNIILLDISLPGMDGYRVLDEIRKDDSLNNTPVIALTAKAMKGDREELIKYGFNDYIAKPIDGGLLEKTILEWLNEK